jgi:hypothetical protein
MVSRLSCSPLPLASAHVTFDLAGLPVQVERHQGVAFLLDLADQAADLVLVHEQLFGPHRIGPDVGRGGSQRVDLAADDEQLAVADDHIAVSQLHLALTQGFDLPALQHDASLKALFKEIIEDGLLVVGNTAVLVCRGNGFFCHVFQLGVAWLQYNGQTLSRPPFYENCSQVRSDLVQR